MRDSSAQGFYMTEVLSCVHHAAASPLSSLLNLTEILLSEVDGPLNDEMRRDVMDMAADVGRLEALLRDLMDLCRLDGNGIVCEPLNLLHPIQEAVAEVSQQLAGTGKDLRTDLPAELPLVWANTGSVHNLVSRLLALLFADADRATVRVFVQTQRVVVCLEGDIRLSDGWLTDELAPKLLICERLLEMQSGALWVDRGICFSLPIHEETTAG